MPESFEWPGNTEIWIPLSVDPLATVHCQDAYVTVTGRLAEQATLDQASVEMARIALQLDDRGWFTIHARIPADDRGIPAEGVPPRLVPRTTLGAAPDTSSPSAKSRPSIGGTGRISKVFAVTTASEKRRGPSGTDVDRPTGLMADQTLEGGLLAPVVEVL